jgi:hypothetical protein
MGGNAAKATTAIAANRKHVETIDRHIYLFPLLDFRRLSTDMEAAE